MNTSIAAAPTAPATIVPQNAEHAERIAAALEELAGNTRRAYGFAFASWRQFADANEVDPLEPPPAIFRLYIKERARQRISIVDPPASRRRPSQGPGPRRRPTDRQRPDDHRHPERHREGRRKPAAAGETGRRPDRNRPRCHTRHGLQPADRAPRRFGNSRQRRAARLGRFSAGPDDERCRAAPIRSRGASPGQISSSGRTDQAG